MADKIIHFTENQLNPISRLATLYASDETFLPGRPGRFIVCPRIP